MTIRGANAANAARSANTLYNSGNQTAGEPKAVGIVQVVRTASSSRSTSETSERKPNPFVSVIGWEVRRTVSDGRSWLLAAAVFLGACLQVPLNASRFDVNQLNFPGLNAFGVVTGYTQVLSAVFIAIGSGMVARDLTRRTHEVLMSTPLPTRAYVWGRWLAGVLICLTLSFIAILGIIICGGCLYLLDPGTYHMPDLTALLVAFAVIVPVVICLTTAASFALGTLLPRWANPIIGAVTATWLVGIPLIAANFTDKANTWLPSQMLMLNAMARNYSDDLLAAQSQPQYANINFEQQVKLAHEVGAYLPGLAPWLWQLSYIGVGFVLVAIAARYFRRFSGLL